MFQDAADGVILHSTEEAAMSILLRAMTALSLMAFAAATAATAGDGDYDAAADAEGKGPAYFGFVRDARGSPVPDARVALQSKDR